MKEENIKKGYFKGDGNPFSVPQGYFQESREEIMNLIREEQGGKETKTIRMRARLVWISGIAASFILGLFLFNNLYLTPKNDLRIAQEIDWLIDYSGSDLDYLSLASYVSDEGLAFEGYSNDGINEEQSTLLDITDYEEIYIIEEWMKIENQ